MEVLPEQDAETGKILHETRKGEMAALNEIPYGRYYGSIDATPLFIMLAGAYYERTGDQAFITQIWPNIELALQWIDCAGDLDGDGFVEYSRRSKSIKDGKIRRMPYFMQMAAQRKGPSRSAKCKGMCLPPSGARLDWRWRWAIGSSPAVSSRRRTRYALSSSDTSGAMTSPPMP
jgi:hypothetical protein